MKSLRGRLTLWLMAGTGLLLAVGGLALDRVISSRLQREFDDALVTRARSLATLTEQESGAVWLELADGTMPEFEAAEKADYFQLWLGDGPVLKRSRSLGRRDLPRSGGGPLDQPLLRDLTLPDGRPGRLAEVRFHPRHEEEETLEREGRSTARPPGPRSGVEATVVVARGREELDAFTASLHVLLTLFVLALLAGMAVLVKLSLGVSLASLDDLSRRLSGMHADSLGEALEPADTPAELVPLVLHLNGLLARLKESFAREREFSADLAHELRSPIAELRALAEVSLKWQDDDFRWPELSADVREVALQMERIVLNLLALARCDGRQYTVLMSKVSLSEVVESCWSALDRESEEKGVTLRTELPDTLTVVTDPEKLSLILSNLLSNAVEYGSPGCVVTCSGAVSRGEFALRIGNPTDALTPEDVPRIFDRFWRKDPARSGGQHAGLGLPLVSALCKLLGLTVEAHLAGGVFEVTLLGPLRGTVPANLAPGV